jgi:hypothetical protein
MEAVLDTMYLPVGFQPSKCLKHSVPLYFAVRSEVRSECPV